jgi:hypothetical protein
MKKTQILAILLLLALFVCSCASIYAGKRVRYVELRNHGCYICQRMDAVTDEIVAKYSSEVDFTSYTDSLDEGAQLIKKYNVTRFPSNLLFDTKGNLVFRYDGVLDLRAIEEQLFRMGVGSSAKNTTATAAAK